MPSDTTSWWAAFGAISQAAAAFATFAAVVLSLWIVLSERAIRAKGNAGIKVMFAGDGTPGTYFVGIYVLNEGLRPFNVTGVGWQTGWLRLGPKVLSYRFALQNPSVMYNDRGGSRKVEPGCDEIFLTSIEDMKRHDKSEATKDLFQRRLPILGDCPIRAMIHITGRKPLSIKVSRELKSFLITREHASNTDDEK